MTTMARQLADRTGASLAVEDQAPLSPQNPNGTFEFYAIVFLGVGCSLGATITFVILGNTSAGGAVARPLLNTFYSALTPLLPHGAATSTLRDVQYFNHQGITGGVTSLLMWSGLGLLLLGTGALRPGHVRRTPGRSASPAH
ncbi:hypothetical protein [Streptomyces coeruleorubidus]|uniref:hypothetical protein n=1 Tax=Streptomyces coeruleorubidus TaxID=116188 RepID=UPI00369B6D89